MLSIDHLTHYIGGRCLFDDTSLHIHAQDKIGLVGLNGVGKTTLFHILTQHITPEQGKISMEKSCTLGFLNQDLLSYHSDASIRGVAMQAFSSLLEQQDKMNAILQQMEVAYSDALMEELAHLQELFSEAGGYELQSKTDKILEGIGFRTDDLEKPLHTFSGGWRMRVMLAKLLLEEPSLLLLDEPTNHLDIDSIQWVEHYLRGYSNSFIVISHDRTFLDQVTEKTVEVSQKKLNIYAGNYTFYEKEKASKEVLQQQAYKNQQKNLKQKERFIERFRSKSSKAKQVQSRIKELDKIERVEPVSQASSSLRIRFPMQKQPGKCVVELKHMHKAYGDHILLQDASVSVSRGDKIALIGANGGGKSTLLRLISQEEEMDKGTLEQGQNTEISFYAQHQLESLNISNTILEELQQIGSEKSETELRSILGAFLFTKEDVKKHIKVLSGGEKARVALAKVLIHAANFLLLDEPTNHFDMISIQMLLQALQKYEGTLLFVSHNRYFIRQLATKIWYLEGEKVRTYNGTYEEYAYWCQHHKKRT